MPASHVVTKAALALASLMYLDSKYYLRQELGEIASGLKAKNKVLAEWEYLAKNENHFSGYSVLEKVIQTYPDREAFVFCDRTSGQLVLQRWTYAQMEEEIARLADWYTSMGVQAKDVVAIYLPNVPQIFFTFWALAKINAVGALINSNQTGAPLIHSIKISKAKLIITHRTTFQGLQDVEPELPHTNIVVLGYKEPVPEKCPYQCVDSADLRRSGKSDELRKTLKVESSDSVCYIYTSGTTGLPKAVAMPHRQIILPMFSLRYSGQILDGDKWYCCLPMYHSSAIVIAMCGSLSVGGTFVLSTKFSTNNCMEDIAKTNSTGFSYIGEIARYLLNSKPTPWDKAHKLRFAYGNGLSKSVWEKFRDRYNIPVINEFYGATEGNAFLRNVNTGPEGVGYIAHRGILTRRLITNLRIVKQDPETLEPYRDPKTGFCVVADFDEPGEILGEQVPIIGQSRSYVDNKEANNKVTMRDVFKKGDVWHRQGDLLKMNKDGWIEFCDRVGDTFRWRGENVSTMEVAAVMSLHPNVDDITVYGISLPKYEGQVGMATIVSSNPELVVTDLRSFLKNKGLPLYAHPRFVRVIDEIPTTQTHKHQKAGLRKEGISMYNTVPIYMLTDDGNYVRMTDANYKTVQSGVAKL